MMYSTDTIELDNDFEIRKLYTGVDNVNFETKDLLEEALVYTTREETIKQFKNDNIVPIYALANLKTKEIYSETFGLDNTLAYTDYFWNYAPVLDEDNTIYRDVARNLKIAKKYLTLSVGRNYRGKHYVLDVSNTKEDWTIGMFYITDLADNKIQQIDCFSSTFPIHLL